MLPDDDALAREWDYVPLCLDCDATLEDGQRYRCRACRDALTGAPPWGFERVGEWRMS